jgi:hypothetical protein
MKRFKSDDLAYMHDDELYSLLRNIREAIFNMRRKRNQTSDAEIELCYIQREVEKRSLRKSAHKKFLLNRY